MTELLVLAAVAIMLAAIEIRVDAHRPLWFDEIGSMVVATRPTLHEMFRALPADGNPPLFFLLARFFMALSITPEIALHLPSIVATAVTAAMIFLFVRRNTRSLYAFLAVGVFYASPFAMFAPLEARPYALLLCFTSVALCCWQAAVRSKSKLLPIAGVALATAAAVLSHQYGIIYVGFPLFVAEAVRSWSDRRIHFATAAAVLVGATSLLYTFPPMLAAQAGLLSAVKHSQVFLARPSLASLSLYTTMLPPFVPLAALAAAILALLAYSLTIAKAKSDSTLRGSPIPLEEYAAGLALTLLLPLMLILTSFGTRYFWARYAVGAIAGVAILTGFVASRLSRRLAAVDFLAIAGVIYCLIFAIAGTLTARLPEGALGAQTDPLFLSVKSGEPIVIADAVVYSPTWWYSNSAKRAQIHYLSDLDFAVKKPEFVAEYSLALEQPYGAPRIDGYKEYLAAHPEFLLFTVGAPTREWIANQLMRDGWHFALIGSEGSKKLYRVTRPSS